MQDAMVSLCSGDMGVDHARVTTEGWGSGPRMLVLCWWREWGLLTAETNRNVLQWSGSASSAWMLLLGSPWSTWSGVPLTKNARLHVHSTKHRRPAQDWQCRTLEKQGPGKYTYTYITNLTVVESGW